MIGQQVVVKGSWTLVMEQWTIVLGDSTVFNNYRTLEHYEGAVKYSNGRMEQCEKIMI